MLCAHAEGSERAEDTLQLRCIGSGIFLDTDDGGVPGDSATGWAPGTGLPGGFDSGGEDYDDAFCARDAACVCGNGPGVKVQGQPEAGDLQWRSAWGINPGQVFGAHGGRGVDQFIRSYRSGSRRQPWAMQNGRYFSSDWPTGCQH